MRGFFIVLFLLTFAGGLCVYALGLREWDFSLIGVGIAVMSGSLLVFIDLWNKRGWPYDHN